MTTSPQADRNDDEPTLAPHVSPDSPSPADAAGVTRFDAGENARTSSDSTTADSTTADSPAPVTPPATTTPASTTAVRPLEAMDEQLTTIQPGGGIVMSIELIWGRLRRRMLRRFWPRYVDRMLEVRQGRRGNLPFDPIDPRDLKYYRNQDTYWWADADDPFVWRDHLPFVRAGLAELVLLTSLSLVIGVSLAFLWWPLAIPFVIVAGLIVWFFRNPQREVPAEPGTVVSPADGRLVEIERVEDAELGPSIRFGIFLSIFNVHANRASLPGRVLAVRYRPGKFLNALRPESARENENLDIVVEESESTGRLFRIRQITGQFARRIVCWTRPGDVLMRGEMYGMIKLGSRTELLIPLSDSLEIDAKVGQKVSAGSTVLARYRPRIGDRSGLTEHDRLGLTRAGSASAGNGRPFA